MKRAWLALAACIALALTSGGVTSATVAAGTGRAVTAAEQFPDGDGPPGFWWGTDSLPVTVPGSAPYSMPHLGGAYGGYIGARLPVIHAQARSGVPGLPVAAHNPATRPAHWPSRPRTPCCLGRIWPGRALPMGGISTRNPDATPWRQRAATSSAWNKADQVALRVLEPRRLAATRHPGNAVLGPCLRRVVLLELHAATPHLLDAARTSVTWMTACVNSPTTYPAG